MPSLKIPSRKGASARAKLGFKHLALFLFFLLLILSHTDAEELQNDLAVASNSEFDTESSPIHPRVDINMTLVNGREKKTRKERKRIEKSDLVLVKLLVINRHGHRAPNAVYWRYCPNDLHNKKHYNVNPEDLTSLGMLEEYQFGQYIRNKYKKFLGNKYNRTLHFFRAVGEPRIIQSALAVSQGMFPDGYGPGGFMPGRPQFVPIFSDMDTHEYLLDDVPCFKRAEADSKRWIEKNFKRFKNDPNVHSTLNLMKELCGEPTIKNAFPKFGYVKAVADGIVFNNDFGIKSFSGKLTPSQLFQIRNVSYQLLMSRLYSTDEQQTYTVVDLPYQILRLFNHTHPAQEPQINDFVDTRQEATFYFVHREALYALAQFFGFEYSVAGLPPGEIPVASSLIIEKLMPRKDQYTYNEKKSFIKMTLWTPNNATSTISISHCRIPQLCELDELRDIFNAREKRTGSWEKLCNYVPSELDHTTDVR